MIKKICCSCKIEKNVSEFGKKKSNKDGLQIRCKECRSLLEKKDRIKYYNKNKEEINEKRKEYRLENLEEVRKYYRDYGKKYRKKNEHKLKKRREKYKEREREYGKQYRKLNKEKIKEYDKKYKEKNPNYYKIYRKEYREKNKEQINEHYRIRRKTDKIYKLVTNYRTRIGNFIRQTDFTKNKKTIDMVGLIPVEFKEYIESLFNDGMSWNNYGIHGWHIDHIIPLSSAETEDEVYNLCHYTNLQPLWSEENLSKGDKFLED